MSEIYFIHKNSFKDIKSKYIIIFIFSYLNEKTKLEIIKYNKKIQNILDITLTNYKFWSTSYIIYESNKKGKQYDGNEDYLEFDGEYLNGKRNGKGKEYNYDGNLIFEGEYLNGKRKGKGKEYYKDNKIKFEGEYFNGLRWNGKGYDSNNNIVYELKNGKGYVKEYSEEKLIFEGAYLNGQINGKCKKYDWKGNLIFEGTYLNNERNGKGKEYNENEELEFEGEYLYGHKLKGKFYYKGKLEYDG